MTSTWDRRVARTSTVLLLALILLMPFARGCLSLALAPFASDSSRRAARRRELAEETAAREEVLNNVRGVQPSPQGIARAKELLAILNETVSRGASDSRPTVLPLFQLDYATGRLTLRLTPTETYQLMLHHVVDARLTGATYRRVSTQNTDGTITPGPIEARKEVSLITRRPVVLVSKDGNHHWRSTITVTTDTKVGDLEQTDFDTDAQADTIEQCFKGLMALYKEVDKHSPENAD